MKPLIEFHGVVSSPTRQTVVTGVYRMTAQKRISVDEKFTTDKQGGRGALFTNEEVSVAVKAVLNQTNHWFAELRFANHGLCLNWVNLFGKLKD